jgi:hypothetical protein
MAEQRHAYKGSQPTPWVTVRFATSDGSSFLELDLAVDTGDFAEARVSSAVLQTIMVAEGPRHQTNFGLAAGGWVQYSIPDLIDSRWSLIYATDELVTAVQNISPDFAGQVGMLFLQQFEYGGNATEFWLHLP